MEEKDKQIHLLESKVKQVIFKFIQLLSTLIHFNPFRFILILFDLFQVTKDNRKIAEENARYQKENDTLVKALATITSKDSPGGPPSKKT